MERFEFTELRNRVSWGSVFGGVMTVLAISILLSILSTSIGLYMFDPLSDHPTEGIGTSVGIWTAVALIISMIAGGFVAGKLAGTDGMIHGFLVWATTLIVAIILAGMLAVGAAKMTANILGSVTSMTGSVISGVGSAVGNGASALSDQAKDLFGDVDFNSDLKGEDIPKDIRTALAKSNVKELQPEFLQNQMQDVKSDLEKSVKKIATHPQDADKIIDKFLDAQKKRVDKISKNIDRNDLVKAISNNTNLSREEANKAIDQYMVTFDKAKKEAQEQINNLEQALDKAKKEWNQMKHEALKAADEATDAAATSALISFFAILIAAILCSLAGAYGTRTDVHQHMTSINNLKNSRNGQKD